MQSLYIATTALLSIDFCKRLNTALINSRNMEGAVTRSVPDIPRKECRFNLFRLKIGGYRRQATTTRKRHRNFRRGRFFSDLTPPTYKEGAFCFSSSLPPPLPPARRWKPAPHSRNPEHSLSFRIELSDLLCLPRFSAEQCLPSISPSVPERK